MKQIELDDLKEWIIFKLDTTDLPLEHIMKMMCVADQSLFTVRKAIQQVMIDEIATLVNYINECPSHMGLYKSAGVNVITSIWGKVRKKFNDSIELTDVSLYNFPMYDENKYPSARDFIEDNINSLKSSMKLSLGHDDVLKSPIAESMYHDEHCLDKSEHNVLCYKNFHACLKRLEKLIEYFYLTCNKYVNDDILDIDRDIFTSCRGESRHLIDRRKELGKWISSNYPDISLIDRITDNIKFWQLMSHYTDIVFRNLTNQFNIGFIERDNDFCINVSVIINAINMVFPGRIKHTMLTRRLLYTTVDTYLTNGICIHIPLTRVGDPDNRISKLKERYLQDV